MLSTKTSQVFTPVFSPRSFLYESLKFHVGFVCSHFYLWYKVNIHILQTVVQIPFIAETILLPLYKLSIPVEHKVIINYVCLYMIYVKCCMSAYAHWTYTLIILSYTYFIKYKYLNTYILYIKHIHFSGHIFHVCLIYISIHITHVLFYIFYNFCIYI
jgi:hypothetical protein